jgi:hypothetical protein
MSDTPGLVTSDRHVDHVPVVTEATRAKNAEMMEGSDRCLVF